jgi:antitoxin HigA-1
MNTMHNPPHLGLTLLDDVIPALGLTLTSAAKQLGITRPTMSRVSNGRSAISPEMALRIEKWLGVERGGDARVWLGQQMAHDLWQVQERVKTKPLKVPAASVLVDLRLALASNPPRWRC